MKTNFGDKDDFPGMSDAVQVDVLGINLLPPPGKDPTLGASGTAAGTSPALDADLAAMR